MKRLALLVTLPLMLFIAACSPASSPSSSAGGSKVAVYASTIVWASVAQAVGGDHVTVQSSISRPDQDPHDYEVTAQDKNLVSKAAVAVVNGGGYDDWALKLTEGGKAGVVNAVDASGLKKDGEKEFNEHVFYSLDGTRKVADAIASALSKADPAHGADYTANAKTFGGRLDTLTTNAKAVGEGKDLTAFATEPVTGYLMETMGIKDVTPDEFVEQSETDAGPSAKVQSEAQEVLKAGDAKLLVLNAQTETDVSKTLDKVADGAHVPVVKVNETFPAGITDYATWVQHTIDDFSTAAKQVK